VPDGFELVAGAHRIAAGCLIGLVDIAANVVDLDDIRARLAEIDENLIRSDLTHLERAEALAERKQLYLAEHKETAAGVAGGLAGGRGRPKGNGAIANETVSFAIDTARQVGSTARSIEQHVQIAESIPEDVRMRLRGTKVAQSRPRCRSRDRTHRRYRGYLNLNGIEAPPSRMVRLP